MASEIGGNASDLFPDYPKYKTPPLSYETHPNYLKYGYLQAFRGRILPYICMYKSNFFSWQKKARATIEVALFV